MKEKNDLDTGRELMNIRALMDRFQYFDPKFRFGNSRCIYEAMHEAAWDKNSNKYEVCYIGNK